MKCCKPWLPMVLLTSLSPLACTKAKESDRTTPLPGNGSAVAAQTSALGILTISADLREDGMLLHIGNVPDGSTLACTIDQLPLIPCNDGGLYAKPGVGDHKISATALNGSAITALGESPVFSVAPGAIGALTSGGGVSTLALALDDVGFTNGANWPLSKDFSVRFKLLTKAGCDNPQIRCRYDNLTSQFWANCDVGGASFSVGKDQLALGIQYLAVQAHCPDRSGPALNLFWYGVPDGYQALQLRDVSDSNNRHTVDLIKQDDCPEGSARTYECAQAATDPFSPCLNNSNSLEHPAVGYRIRLTCGSTAGPALSIGA